MVIRRSDLLRVVNEYYNINMKQKVFNEHVNYFLKMFKEKKYISKLKLRDSKQALDFYKKNIKDIYCKEKIEFNFDTELLFVALEGRYNDFKKKYIDFNLCFYNFKKDLIGLIKKKYIKFSCKELLREYKLSPLFDEGDLFVLGEVENIYYGKEYIDFFEELKSKVRKSKKINDCDKDNYISRIDNKKIEMIDAFKEKYVNLVFILCDIFIALYDFKFDKMNEDIYEIKMKTKIIINILNSVNEQTLLTIVPKIISIIKKQLEGEKVNDLDRQIIKSDMNIIDYYGTVYKEYMNIKKNKKEYEDIEDEEDMLKKCIEEQDIMQLTENIVKKKIKKDNLVAIRNEINKFIQK